MVGYWVLIFIRVVIQLLRVVYTEGSARRWLNRNREINKKTSEILKISEVLKVEKDG